MQKKSQYSMEFLIFFALISIVFSVWLIIYSDLHEEVFMERDAQAVMDLGKAIQTHIFLASNSHTGYSSNTLIIPDKAGNKKISLETNNYSFTIATERGDYVFNTPYLFGNLNIGENKLRNFNGVVVAGNMPIIIGDDGTIRAPNCSDMTDNDEDDLIDEEDGGCWVNTEPAVLSSEPTSPAFKPDLDNEWSMNPNTVKTETNDATSKNYYVICKNSTSQGLSGYLSCFKPLGKGKISCEPAHSCKMENNKLSYSAASKCDYNIETQKGLMGLGMFYFLRKTPSVGDRTPKITNDTITDLLTYFSSDIKDCSVVGKKTGLKINEIFRIIYEYYGKGNCYKDYNLYEEGKCADSMQCLNGIWQENCTKCSGCSGGLECNQDTNKCQIPSNMITIDKCQNLSAPGYYLLNKDLLNILKTDVPFKYAGTGVCFNINSNNVTIDCDNHKLHSSEIFTAITSNSSYTTIKNCHIDDMGEYPCYNYCNDYCSNSYDPNDEEEWHQCIYYECLPDCEQEFGALSPSICFIKGTSGSYIANNIIRNSNQIRVLGSGNKIINNNIFSSGYLESSGNNSIISNNTLNNSGMSISGSANNIGNNLIDGYSMTGLSVSGLKNLVRNNKLINNQVGMNLDSPYGSKLDAELVDNYICNSHSAFDVICTSDPGTNFLASGNTFSKGGCFASTGSCYGGTEVDSCRLLDQDNATYELTQDIKKDTLGYCLYVTKSGVTIDGKGHTITGFFDGADSGGGIYGSGVNNITIKNIKLTNGRGIDLDFVKNANILNVSVSKTNYALYSEYSTVTVNDSQLCANNLWIKDVLCTISSISFGNTQYDSMDQSGCTISGNQNPCAVRAIGKCQNIYQPGYYYLNNDILNVKMSDIPETPIGIAKGACINILAKDVTMDCQGSKLSSAESYTAIYSNSSNIAIKNCNISNYRFDAYTYCDQVCSQDSLIGLPFNFYCNSNENPDSDCRYYCRTDCIEYYDQKRSVINLTNSDNSVLDYNRIDLVSGGAYIKGDNVNVTNNIIMDFNNDGLVIIGNGANVINNKVQGDSDYGDAAIVAGTDYEIIGNNISAKQYGLSISWSSSGSIINNRMCGNWEGDCLGAVNYDPSKMYGNAYSLGNCLPVHNSCYADSLNIDKCTILDMENSVYNLTTDISDVSGTCFQFSGNGITLNGNGHTITGASSPYASYGFYAPERHGSGYDNLAVKNITIKNFNYGIFSDANNINITNVNASFNRYGLRTWGETIIKDSIFCMNIYDPQIWELPGADIGGCLLGNSKVQNVMLDTTGFEGEWCSIGFDSATGCNIPEYVDKCKTLSIPNRVYKLTKNIDSISGDCFNIQADNIVLDGQGFTITGMAKTCQNGIVFNATNVKITNLNVNNFDRQVYDIANKTHIFDIQGLQVWQKPSMCNIPKPVNTCQKLNESFLTYRLDSSLTGITGTCFQINNVNITLDGNGKSITGTKGTSTGVSIQAMNTTVKNLNIDNFNKGIDYLISPNSNLIYNNISNSNIGIYAYSSLNQNTKIFFNNVYSNNYGMQFILDSYPNISFNNIYQNSQYGVFFSSGNGYLFENNMINNYRGIYSNRGGLAVRNIIINSTYGVSVQGTSSISLINNYVCNSSQYDLMCPLTQADLNIFSKSYFAISDPNQKSCPTEASSCSSKGYSCKSIPCSSESNDIMDKAECVVKMGAGAHCCIS